jgi:hypothetical protein
MEPFSGSEAKVYSIIPEGENVTLFEKFVDENKVVYKEEIKDILKRLKQIGHATGARESFFKHSTCREREYSRERASQGTYTLFPFLPYYRTIPYNIPRTTRTTVLTC